MCDRFDGRCSAVVIHRRQSAIPNRPNRLTAIIQTVLFRELHNTRSQFRVIITRLFHLTSINTSVNSPQSLIASHHITSDSTYHGREQVMLQLELHTAPNVMHQEVMSTRRVCIACTIKLMTHPVICGLLCLCSHLLRLMCRRHQPKIHQIRSNQLTPPTAGPESTTNNSPPSNSVQTSSSARGDTTIHNTHQKGMSEMVMV